MKLYIAGPMTGYPDLNYPAFHEAESRLKSIGYETLNPALNIPAGKATWLAYMRMSLVQIAQADGIALLDEWYESKGARIEHDLAISLGLEVRPLNHWLNVQTATKQFHNDINTRAGRRAVK